MSRIAYVNGRYRPIAAPAIGIEDRGYQFADGVYEVIKVVGGRPRDLDRHLTRLRRSLGELEIAPPMGEAGLVAVIEEVRRRNRLREALIYLQITRGSAPRNHLFPTSARPSFVVTARQGKWPRAEELEKGVAVMSHPDERWARCDIKSISLLPNAIARQRAAEGGFREALLVDREGMVTECSSANAYMVDANGTLITHPLGRQILGGITRSVVLELARSAQIKVEERPFSLDEAKDAAEMALSSTSAWILPVVRVDTTSIDDGSPGPTIRRLLDLYRARLDGS